MADRMETVLPGNTGGSPDTLAAKEVQRTLFKVGLLATEIKQSVEKTLGKALPDADVETIV